MQLCAWSAGGVTLFTVVGFNLHFGFATASFCYLLILVLQSLFGDFTSSALVALFSVGCLDYFFVEPLFSFQVDTPVDTLGLASFLITGLVITKLVTKLRARTESSRLHREQVERLFNLAQQLLSVEPGGDYESQFLERFRGVLGVTAACVFEAAGAEIYLTGNASDTLEKRTGEAFIHCQDLYDLGSGFSARCIRVGGRITGAIGFEGLEDPTLTAGPMAALAAAYLERTHSFAHASRAASAAQAESYRSAILDALAHEFKTPLSTILTVAGALGEAPSLNTEDREMAKGIESVAARLGQLTSRLIRTARLERQEVRPWIELLDVYTVAADSVAQYVRLSGGRSIRIVKDCESSVAMADPELLRLALSQLLDNACKYSTPGSSVSLRISCENDQIAVRIRSSGNPIPAAERTKIFERFYRGMDGLRVGPGSGLGLFVARKIALALGGGLELEAGDGVDDGTEFRLTLPCDERLEDESDEIRTKI
jgi:two-component system, OmpR family, sensor histidine kinase KdpD